MNKSVILVAGGSGKRMQSQTPKQFLLLRGRPVLMHTLQVFFRYSQSLHFIVVLPGNAIEIWKQLCRQYGFTIPHKIATGGSQRFYSVKNGLAHIQHDGLVAVHDGVRPLVSSQTIHDSFSTAEDYGTAVPSVSSRESLRMLTTDGSRAVDRNTYRLIQTPQVFRAEILKNAYQQPFRPFFTDDASLVEQAGNPIHLVEGNTHNIKITTPEDLAIAETLMQLQAGE